MAQYVSVFWFNTKLAIENPLVGFSCSVASVGKGLTTSNGSGIISDEIDSVDGRSGDDGTLNDKDDEDDRGGGRGCGGGGGADAMVSFNVMASDSIDDKSSACAARMC